MRGTKVKALRRAFIQQHDRAPKRATLIRGEAGMLHPAVIPANRKGPERPAAPSEWRIWKKLYHEESREWKKRHA